MGLQNSNVSSTGLVEKYVGTAYDTVKLVADNIESVVILAAVDDIAGVADDVNAAVADSQAAASASQVSADASEVSNLASAASAAESADSATEANTSKSESRNSELAAASSASTAGSAASAASDSAAEAVVTAADVAAEVLNAHNWSSEAEDVAVDDGVNPAGFSAYHWAQKAEDAAAAGESNTSSNSGSGEGIALAKAGVDLPFKSIKATNLAAVSSDADSITIDVPAFAHSVLTGEGDSDSHPIAAITGLQAALDLKATIDAPTFTGVPLAPTASGGTNTTQLATTQFVQSAIVTKSSLTNLQDNFLLNLAIG